MPERELSAVQRGIERTLGHSFRRAELLQRALTHPSYVNEHPNDGSGDNQRLEFLGDAVLDFVVGEWLFHSFPLWDEGSMSRLRAALVCTEALARLAENAGIGPAMRLGRGEEASGGRHRAANLCDAFEAVIGALYLDAGMRATRRYLKPLLAHAAEQVLAREAGVDNKSRLQELCQGEMGITPHYRIVSEHGPDHQKMFLAEALLGNAVLGRGSGPSKQSAEQSAAGAALQSLSNEVRTS